MQLFHIIRKSYGRLGIYRSQSNIKFDSFNSRNVTVMIIFSVSYISVILNFLLECETSEDYSKSIFQIATTTAMLIISPINVWNSAKIYNVIDNLEVFIQRREFHQLVFVVFHKSKLSSITTVLGVEDPVKQPFYETASLSIEKWTGLMDLIIGKFPSRFPVFLNVIYTSVRYVMTDLTDEDYVLILPFW